MHLLLQKLLREIEANLSGLDAAQTQLRPKDNAARWSIQQIMEHLLLTYISTGDLCERRVMKGRPTKGRPSLLQRAGQCAVCRFGYFPHGRLSPAAVAPPERVTPTSGEMLVVQARDVLAHLDGIMAEAERLFGEKRAVTHHVLGPLNAHQWLRFHLIHGRHHLRQIRAIRKGHGV